MRKSGSVGLGSTKNIAVIAMYASLLVAAQLALSFTAGIELVSLLLCAFCVVFGVWRGVLVAVVFVLLRCVVFGVVPNVFALYAVYYPLYALTIALYGKLLNKFIPAFSLSRNYKSDGDDGKSPLKRTLTAKNVIIYVSFIALVALLTCSFTMLDNLIAPLMMGMTESARATYLYYSLPTMLTHAVFATSTVAVLFLPVRRILTLLKAQMRI